MDRETMPAKVSSAALFATVMIFIAYFFGYTFGKDLAETHNAQDAREAARVEVLDR